MSYSSEGQLLDLTLTSEPQPRSLLQYFSSRMERFVRSGSGSRDPEGRLGQLEYNLYGQGPVIDGSLSPGGKVPVSRYYYKRRFHRPRALRTDSRGMCEESPFSHPGCDKKFLLVSESRLRSVHWGNVQNILPVKRVHQGGRDV